MWWTKDEDTNNLSVKGRNFRVGDTLGTTKRLINAAIAAVSLSAALSIIYASSAVSLDSFGMGIEGVTVTLPSSSGAIFQCGGYYSFSPTVDSYGIFNPDDLSLIYDVNGEEVDYRVPTAPMLVPAYGYMTDEQPLQEGKIFYSYYEELPPLTSILRSMYDGNTIIWYTEAASTGTIQSLKTFAGNHPGVIIMPWAGTTLGIPGFSDTYLMPKSRQISFSAWNITQSCLAFNSDVAGEFLDFVDSKKGKNIPSSTPPAATIKEGRLSSIGYSGTDL